MTWNCRLTSFRGLLQALLALAVLLAPVAANAMDQSMAAMSSHHQQASASKHCSGPSETGSKHDKAPGKTCCASMCMAVAVTRPGASAEGLAAPSLPAFSSPVSLIGSPGELATPPPRLA